MDSAPRDGTVIEVQCNYGVAPWFGLYRWTNKRMVTDQYGNSCEWLGGHSWVSAGDDASGFTEDASFSWRPYSGAAAYCDPTGGAQDTRGYWLEACGMPVPPSARLSFSEEAKIVAARPVATSSAKTHSKGGFPQWLFGR